MKSLLAHLPAIALGVGAVFPPAAGAAEPTWLASTADVALEAGPYVVVISAKEKFSIANLFFENYEIGTHTGFYGTILAPEQNKFIGAGHKEGGEEQVQAVAFTVDGQPAETPAGVLRGNEIAFTKKTRLANIDLDVTMTINADGIRVDKQWRATAEQKIASFYIYQYCWSVKTNEWLYSEGPDDFTNGAFKSDDGWQFRARKDLRWFAVYATNDQKGMLGYFADYQPKQDMFMLWDRKGDHKFYFWPSYPQTVPAGFQSPRYSLILKGLGAADDWKAEAKKVAVALEAKFPPPPPPSAFSFLPGPDGLTLQGTEKFQAHKIPLTLAPNATYDVFFAIRKSPDTTPKGTDNCILVGQFDKDRKFTAFVTLGHNTPRDNEWHEVKGTFKTPAALFDLNAIIYNSNAKGPLSVRDLRIAKQQ